MSENGMDFLRQDARSVLADASANAEWQAQKWIWITDATDGFVAANIIEEKADTVEVKLSSGAKKVVPKNDTYKMNPPKFDKVEDMAELGYLHEPAVLDNLRKRYQSNMIYTYSGLFCVVVNPYKRLPIYSKEVVAAYNGKRRIEMPPHVYAIADSAYRDMLQDRENQSILITGESGAGKTENTKKVIQYLGSIAIHTAEGSGALEEQLLQCNPVLEAFGNAKTIKNDNSSRFGKFIRIEFDRAGHITGGNIETYLLEKSRTIRQQTNERNFHIYYQLLKSATPEMREEFMLDDKSCEGVPYLSNSASIRVDSMDDVIEFKTVLESMKVVGISEEETRNIWKSVGTILKMGYLQFTQDRSDQAQMPDDAVASKVCKLLGVSLSEFTKALLKPRIKVGRDLVTKAQTSAQVYSSVEAICKSLHERLFNWLLKRINKTLDTRRAAATFIGILDIAGFEIFVCNSFEQLCINFTNERLQQFFNNHMFVVEQEEYKKEGIQWEFIDFGLDLQPCIDLIDKPMGIFSVLDEEVLLPKSTDKSYVEKLEKHHERTPKFVKMGGKVKRDEVGFKLEHYAGSVEYTCDGWLVKNTDPLNDSVTQLLAKSTDPFVANLWADQAEDAARGGGKRAGSMRTVGQNYREQLNKLIVTLQNTSPHFVRCIIPNHEKKPGKITANVVLDQLRCNGVLEGIRICRKGFPNRVLFQDFKQRYEILTPGVVSKLQGTDSQKACKSMLEALELDVNNYRIGSSKIFFKTGVLGKLEEQRDEKLSSIIRNLQAFCRGTLARKGYRKLTGHETAVKIIQRNCKKYLILRNWHWWKLFVRVQPLLKVTQEENLKKELTDSKKKLDEITKRNEDLQKEYDALNEEKNGVKSDLDRVVNDLDNCNETIERLQTRINQLQKEADVLEDNLEKESEKSDQLLNDKKKLVGERADLQEQLEDIKEKASKLAGEKTTLEEKLLSVSTELDAEKDTNQKLVKEKTNVEAQLAAKSEQLASTEDKLKALQKLKAKGDGTLGEVEEKLVQAEKEKADLVGAKRKNESEIQSLKDRIAELEKKVSELETEVERLKKELSSTGAALETEQERAIKLEKEKRELANQLELVQEELESEQKDVAKLKKEKASLDNFIKELESNMENKEQAGAAQADLRAKRESELTDLRNKHDSLQKELENSLAEAKKKANSKQEELEAEIAALSKSKTENERKIAALQNELTAITEKLAAESKAHSDLDKKKKAADAQLVELNAKLQDSEKKLADSQAQAAKLTTEVNKLNASLDDKEKALSQSEREKSAAKSKIDEVQSQLEDETRQKLNFQGKMKQSELESDELKEQIAEKEEELANAQRTISGLNAQVEEQKNKVNSALAQVEDAEIAKKKNARIIDELNTKVDETKAANSKLHSTSTRLQSELEDITTECEAAKNEAANATKKAKKADAMINEQKVLAQDAESRASQAQADASRAQSEVLSLKSQIAELQEQVAGVKKENSNLKAELEEVQNSSSKDSSYVASLEKAKRALEAEKAEMKTEYEELEDEMQVAEDAKVRLEVAMTALKQQIDRDRAEQEEAVEEGRKGLIRQLREIEESLEDERRSKGVLTSKANKLQSDVTELRSQLDESDKAKEEAIKQAKKAQQIAKDCQVEAENATSQANDLQGKLREAERKVQKSFTDLATLNTDFQRAEKARKAAETSKDEIQSELDALKSQTSGAVESKKRLELEIATLREELEEQQVDLDELADKERKAVVDLEQALVSLASEKDHVAKSDDRVRTLEKANAELREEVENSAREFEKKYKTKVAPLEAKVQTLVADLENETKKVGDSQGKLKRAERKQKDVTRQLEDTEKVLADLKANHDRMNSKVRSLTSQIDSLEEEATSLRGKNKRLTSELSEATGLAEELRSQVQSSQKQQKAARSSRSKKVEVEEDEGSDKE